MTLLARLLDVVGVAVWLVACWLEPALVVLVAGAGLIAAADRIQRR